jgi:hypothetical protein
MSLAAWVGFDDGRASVWASIQDANGHWMRPEPVALDGDRVNSLDLMADGRGRALAMWYEATRPGGGSIFANRFRTTAGWEGAVLVAESGMFPVAGFDASGGALAAWATLEGVMSARLLPDSGWTAEARGLGAGSGTSQVRLAVAPTGHALAVWREQDASAAYETRAALYAPDTGWSPRHRLGVGGDGTPQVLLDGTTGRGLVLAGTDGQVCSQAYLPSEGWGAVECLGPGSDARAAMDAAGVVTAVWTYDDAIWSARLPLRVIREAILLPYESRSLPGPDIRPRGATWTDESSCAPAVRPRLRPRWLRRRRWPREAATRASSAPGSGRSRR